MDNQFSTGTSSYDVPLLIVSWLFIGLGKLFAYMGLNIGDVSMILGCMASVFVIASKAVEMYDRYRARRKNKIKK